MDLLFRVVASVLISGRSHNVRCAFDPEHDRLIIHDDSEPCERRRIVGWGKLGKIFVSPDVRERQDAAIQSRDIYALRRDAAAAVHRACERIRIISQEEDSPRSVHVLWSSKVFTSGERVAVTYGPRASFRKGMTMLVVVSSAITPWIKHLKHFFPFITEDPSLWNDVSVNSRNLETAFHAVDTPVRDSLSQDIPSPLANVVSPLVIDQHQQHQQQHGELGVKKRPSSTAAAITTTTTTNSSSSSSSSSSSVTACSLSMTPSGKKKAEMNNSSSSRNTPSKPLLERDSNKLPIIIQEYDSSSSSSSSSSSNANSNSQVATQLADPCSACSRRLPSSLVVFVESCNHVVCVECATACARYYAEVSLATSYNCPCPAQRCEATLQPHELRPLLSSYEWDTLEVNEMRLAVESGITCPSCKMVFDGVHDNTVVNDPLENRFRCSFCNTTFCVSCGVHPFHEGRPCRDVSQKGQPTCRYCNNPAICTSPFLICGDPACIEKSSRSCTISKSCGHLCYGTRGESNCCSCLEPGCNSQERNVDGLEVDKEDLCAICYVETLSEAPCLELACGHIFHAHCLEARLEHKWPTAAVSYRFLDCPLCTRPIAHQLLGPILSPLQRSRDVLESRYIERLKIEGLLDHPSITSANSEYYNAPISWARQNLTYFECFQCHKPYFGGVRGCMAAMIDYGDGDNDNNNNGGGGEEQYDPEVENPPREQLICAGCSLKERPGESNKCCTEHGIQFLEYKCKYCCNLAVWFCWGTTHFCDACHNPPRKSVRMECPGEELCPLQGRHPPNGTEFLLGCAVCRSNEKIAADSKKKQAIMLATSSAQQQEGEDEQQQQQQQPKQNCKQQEENEGEVRKKNNNQNDEGEDNTSDDYDDDDGDEDGAEDESGGKKKMIMKKKKNEKR